MTANAEGRHRAIFIVRLDEDEAGELTGVVERVLTGETALVDGLEGVAPVLAAMLASEEPRRKETD
jgi:hypothetical protein